MKKLTNILNLYSLSENPDPFSEAAEVMANLERITDQIPHCFLHFKTIEGGELLVATGKKLNILLNKMFELEEDYNSEIWLKPSELKLKIGDSHNFLYEGELIQELNRAANELNHAQHYISNHFDASELISYIEAAEDLLIESESLFDELLENYH